MKNSILVLFLLTLFSCNQIKNTKPVLIEPVQLTIDHKRLIDANNALYMVHFRHYTQDNFNSKIQFLITKVKKSLDMYPKMKLNIVIVDEKNTAYYDDDTIYISLNKICLRVMAHEIAHAVIDNYFIIEPPDKVHEILAQFVERDIY